MRVERREFVWEFSQLSCPGQTRTRVTLELMRVDRREFVWEFSQLSCPGQTRTRVTLELMRVDKREFVWWELASDSLCEFSQLSCPGQTRTKITLKLIRADQQKFVCEFSPEFWWSLPLVLAIYLRPFPKFQTIRRQIFISSGISVSSGVTKPDIESIISQNISEAGFRKVKHPTSTVRQESML